MKKLPAHQNDTDVRIYARIESSVMERINVCGVGLDLCSDNNTSGDYVEEVEPVGLSIKRLWQPETENIGERMRLKVYG